MEALLQALEQQLWTNLRPERYEKPNYTPKKEPVKVNNKTLVQGMKTAKRYQQSQQNDAKTMLWWFYCQPQMYLIHISSAPFLHSAQTNAGNVSIL